MTVPLNSDSHPNAASVLEAAIRDDWARILAGVFHVATGDL